MTTKQAQLEKRRQDIANRVLAGEKTKAIAKSLGMARETVSRIAKTPASHHLISEMLARHHEQVTRLVGKSLDAIEDAFDAQRTGCTKDGAVVEMGADHFARLAATKRLIEVMQAAREDTPQASTAPSTITWEAWLSMTATLPEPPE